MPHIKLHSKLKNLDKIYLLPLISSVAALRDYKKLREISVFLKNDSFSKKEIYETLLQNYLFVGFPNALIALKIADEYFDFNKRESKKQSEPNFKVVGEKYCKKIYGDKYSKLINNVENFSPELSEWLVIEGYGKVLGRKQLSLKKRELSIISVLSCLKFDEQLFSHINGAHRLGVKIDVIENVINNLEILGKSYQNFGSKVLNKFKIQKRI